MKNEEDIVTYILPQFLEDKIIFLDTNCFGLNDYLGIFEPERYGKFSEAYLESNLERLIELSEILDKNSSWTTIKEVPLEFITGTKIFKRKAKERGISKYKKSILYETIKERNKVLEKINDETRLADINRPENITIIGENLIKTIERTFKKIGETPNKLNTDIKLISSTLAYSAHDSVAIYSHDEKLLYTYSDRAEKLDIKNAFIMSDKFDFPMPTQEWLEHVRKGKLKKYKDY